MSTFDSIKAELQKKREEQDSNIKVPAKGTVEMNEKGMPDIARTSGGRVGTLVSMPGSEQVVIDGGSFQLMHCVANAKGREKTRYCVVEKNATTQYGNQFYNSVGHRTHVITRQLFQLLSSVLGAANKKLRQLDSDLSKVKQERDLFKLTIDALKKNGVID